MSRNSHQQSQELKELRDRIEQWRQNRSCKGPMPEELWKEAAELACRLNPSKVASQLSLGYLALKKRVIAKDGTMNGSKGNQLVRSGVQFIEYRQEESISPNEAQQGLVSKYMEVGLTDPSGYRLFVRVPMLRTDYVSTYLKQMWELRACCK